MGDDLVGTVTGKWTVLSYAGRGNDGVEVWNCRCECGTEGLLSRWKIMSPFRYLKCKQCAKGKFGWRNYKKKVKA